MAVVRMVNGGYENAYAYAIQGGASVKDQENAVMYSLVIHVRRLALL